MVATAELVGAVLAVFTCFVGLPENAATPTTAAAIPTPATARPTRRRFGLWAGRPGEGWVSELICGELRWRRFGPVGGSSSVSSRAVIPSGTSAGFQRSGAASSVGGLSIVKHPGILDPNRAGGAKSSPDQACSARILFVEAFCLARVESVEVHHLGPGVDEVPCEPGVRGPRSRRPRRGPGAVSSIRRRGRRRCRSTEPRRWRGRRPRRRARMTRRATRFPCRAGARRSRW